MGVPNERAQAPSCGQPLHEKGDGRALRLGAFFFGRLVSAFSRAVAFSNRRVCAFRRRVSNSTRRAAAFSRLPEAFFFRAGERLGSHSL